MKNKKYARIIITQKLMGIVLMALSILAVIFVPEGFAFALIAVPISIIFIMVNVPFLTCEDTYDFWKNYKE